MKKLIRFLLGQKAPLLQWVTSDMRHKGGSVMTYAKSSIGSYEIYWDDECSNFLLSYPIHKPADVFPHLSTASLAAQEHYNNAYFDHPPAQRRER